MLAASTVSGARKASKPSPGTEGGRERERERERDRERERFICSIILSTMQEKKRGRGYK